MGRGIALQFRQAFPENYELYRRACKQGEVRPGEMFVTQPADQLSDLRYIINFPTKRDWRGKARTEDVETGLVALVDFVRDHEVRSIAIPPLGCGNGGLQWSDVRPKIEAAFASLPQVRVLLYAPEGAPNADKMRVTTKRPNMTLVRAALIALLDRYERPGYRTTLLEVQKLGYFLKSAGEPLPRMEFTRNRYGPYAKTLEHLLRNVEGHFFCVAMATVVKGRVPRYTSFNRRFVMPTYIWKNTPKRANV
jgi:O-acetyl-ADP-ribose deacetylase (regulator of RNase III)